VAVVSGPILALNDVTVRFGGLNACESISLEVNPGELFAMIGPNGAGKTTVVNAITGVYEPIEGASIRFTDGSDTTHDLVGRPPHKIIRLGIARTFQNLGLFDALTVLENLLLGRYIHQRTGVLSGGFLLRRALREEMEQRAAVEKVLDLLEIAKHRNETVGELAFGVRKRVELGRALAQEPHLLLLDEPTAGMNVEEKQDIVRFITDVRAELGTTMMLIEHDMGVVMSIAERIVVLNFGRMIATGTPDQIQNDPEVIAAYLGSETDATAAGGEQ
jgi:branched-chain amino acid transport system ATP-binding protein